MRKRKLFNLLSIISLSIGITVFFSSVFPDVVFGQSSQVGPNGQAGSGTPSDTVLQRQRNTEFASRLDVAVPPAGQVYTPAQRSPRDTYGEVGTQPLALQSLDRLVYPDVPSADRQLLVEGARFFTTPETAAIGLGPMANMPNCLGCHLNANENITSNPGLLGRDPGLLKGLSLVSRAARATPTNFFYVQGNSTTGGHAQDNLDAVNNTGRAATFTIFGDFSPSIDAQRPPGALATTFTTAFANGTPPLPDPAYDPLDNSFRNPAIGNALQDFGGFVQQVRPTVPGCLPERLPSVTEDRVLGSIDPVTGLAPSGFRRSVAERAGPSYIGRGLMEAVPSQDIINFSDRNDTRVLASSLNRSGAVFACTGDCVTGHNNFTPAPNFVPRRFVGSNDPNNLLVGRFGLRANGSEIFQFAVGGLIGSLSATQLINNNENRVSDINLGRPGCVDTIPDPEVNLSVPFSERNFIRLTAPPEFGKNLLTLLRSSDEKIATTSALTPVGKVKRGAELFGVDLVAFANRTITGRMPSGGDGRNLNAINTSDVMVGCVSCHLPIVRTGETPGSRYTSTNDTSTGPDARNTSITRPLTDEERASLPRSDFQLLNQHLSYKYAPLFSDMILHQIPSIQAERVAFIPRTPWRVQATGRSGLDQNKQFNGFDIPRNLADDVFTDQKGAAYGDEFRTATLMGIGRIGAPFLHDGRVYLSSLTVNSTPAVTVTSNSQVTNRRFAIRTHDDALLAAIELHDLPAPDDSRTPAGGGCPVPSNTATNVNYGANAASVICPPYSSPLSRNDNRLAAGPNRTGRSEAKEVMRRFRALTPADQQAMIDFLKEL